MSPFSTAIKCIAPLLLLLCGCSALTPRSDANGASAAPPLGVAITAGQLTSATGCALAYRTYRPTSPVDNGDWVILAPGFLRTERRLRDLAVTLATTGVQVATLDFCNQKPWAGRHVQNASDMQALARHLGAQRVVYAGFSAGGLAALLAARGDPRAIGVVTLDLVDAQGLGVRAAAGLHKPLLALAGEPTNCNAGGNGRIVYAIAPRARVQHIAGAGHCDFESPTDTLCALVCQDPDGARRSHRRQVIVDASAAVSALLDGAAAAWPAPGYADRSRPPPRGKEPSSF